MAKDKNAFRREFKKEKGITFHASKLGQRRVLIDEIVIMLDVYRGIDKDYAMIDGRLKMIYKTRKMVEGKVVWWEVR